MASSRKVVSSLVGFELVGSIPASCGLLPKSGVSFEHSVVWCLAGPRPKSGMALSFKVLGWPTVNCFEQFTTGELLCSKCELASSFEQCTRLGQAWVQWQLLLKLANEFPCGH